MRVLGGIGTIGAAIVATLLALALLRTGSVTSPTGAGSTVPGAAVAGCGEPGNIIDAASPDPVELQRGPGYIPPLVGSAPVVDPENLPASFGFQLPKLPGHEMPKLALRQDVDLDGDGKPEWVIQALYGSRAPNPGENLPQYLDAGGWYLEEQKSIGQGADEVLSRLAEHGRHPLPPVIAVGPYRAVVIHADPILRNDLRPWHLYWSDGQRDFGIQANRGAAFAVAVARSFYCADQVIPTGP